MIRTSKCYCTTFRNGNRHVELFEYTSFLGTPTGAEGAAYTYTKTGRRFYKEIRTYNEIRSWLQLPQGADLSGYVSDPRHETYLGDFTRDHWVGTDEFKRIAFTDQIHG